MGIAKKKIVLTIISMIILVCILIATAFYVNYHVFPFLLKKPSSPIASSIMVYKVSKPVVDQNYTQHYMELFGLNSSASSYTGSYEERIISDGDKQLEIYKGGGFYYCISGPLAKEPTNLPGKDNATIIAVNFLKSNQLLPDDAASVSVGSDEMGTYDSHNHTVSKKVIINWDVGYDRKINGYPVVGYGDRVGVKVGDNGEIIMAIKVWRNLTPYKMMSLKSPDQAYFDLCNDKDSMGSMGMVNKLSAMDVSLGYFTGSGLIDQSYVTPVYIFTGRDFITGSDFTAYVSALSNESELT